MKRQRVARPRLGRFTALAFFALVGFGLSAPAARSSGEEEILAEGSFRGADLTHRGRGMARIVTRDDGSRVLELREFRVTNGPSLRVVLSDHENPRREADFGASHQADLGGLESTEDDQDYFIPDDVDISTVHSIVIYCKPYDVVFSVAALEHRPSM